MTRLFQVTSSELTLALLHDKYLEGEGGVYERMSKQQVGGMYDGER